MFGVVESTTGMAAELTSCCAPVSPPHYCLYCPLAAVQFADLVPPRRALRLRVRGGFGEPHVGPPHPRLPHPHGPLARRPQGI